MKEFPNTEAGLGAQEYLLHVNSPSPRTPRVESHYFSRRGMIVIDYLIRLPWDRPKLLRRHRDRNDQPGCPVFGTLAVGDVAFQAVIAERDGTRAAIRAVLNLFMRGLSLS